MIKEYLENNLTMEQKGFIDFYSKSTEQLLNMLDNSVINNTFKISLPVIAETNPTIVKNFTWIMDKLNMGKTMATGNFAEFTFKQELLDKNEITEWRNQAKLNKMIMRRDTKSYPATLVKRNGKIYNDGLDRSGTLCTSKNEFMLDTDKLVEYRRPIIQNIIKSIKKSIEKGTITDTFFADEANYLHVANACVDYYIENKQLRYNSEYNVQDQRGRAIKNILKRVGNYIAFKDFRAMLIVPEEKCKVISRGNVDTLNSIYLFIAELNGKKCLGGTIEDKVRAGKQCYFDGVLPRLNLKDEHDRAELHELIWLERIYSKLDKVFNSKEGVLWDIPIEIDHSMLK